jgi:hypothetical protein
MSRPRAEPAACVAGVDDLVHLLHVFTCHPGRLPAPVAANPAKYLGLMLDGMQATARTSLS